MTADDNAWRLILGELCLDADRRGWVERVRAQHGHRRGVTVAVQCAKVAMLVAAQREGRLPDDDWLAGVGA